MGLLGTVAGAESKAMLRVLSPVTEITLLWLLRLRKEDTVGDPMLWNGIPRRIKLVGKQRVHYLCSHQHFSGMIAGMLF